MGGQQNIATQSKNLVFAFDLNWMDNMFSSDSTLKNVKNCVFLVQIYHDPMLDAIGICKFAMDIIEVEDGVVKQFHCCYVCQVCCISYVYCIYCVCCTCWVSLARVTLLYDLVIDSVKQFYKNFCVVINFELTLHCFHCNV